MDMASFCLLLKFIIHTNYSFFYSIKFISGNQIMILFPSSQTYNFTGNLFNLLFFPTVKKMAILTQKLLVNVTFNYKEIASNTLN